MNFNPNSSGEKVGMNVELSMNSQKGHASTPPNYTIFGQHSKAVFFYERLLKCPAGGSG